ncbi:MULTISPECIES: cytochrome P450/oxidoreductase [Ramlibacter]|nr:MULTISPECIES: cytochrome P450/oxidoreductase [Ramlibacter]
MNAPLPRSVTSGCPVDHAALRAPNGCPVSARAAAFDPFEDAYLQDPPEYLRWAREQEPVFYNPTLGYWVVSRYDDIKAIFRDHGSFSPSNALEKITPPSEAAQQVLASYGYAMSRTLVNEDEPAHMARRRLLLEPFTPEALRHHEPLVRKLAREYVDRFIDDGRADLVDQMLWEVPLTIALHFLGVDEEDMPLLRKYSIAHTVNTWGRPDEHEQLRVADAVGNFWQLAGNILEKMRRDPSGTGWMKFGIRMQAEHPDVVTDSYLHSMMMAGIVAAHETTANATANAVRLLLQHPTAWRELCEDPSLIPNAVEECLRFSGSIIAWRRVALRDVDVAGVTLPAGSRVLMVMASGNHDGRHFAEADLLDIHRDNAGDHLSFGYGAHQCMGKNLARMELQIFLEELSRRLPHMTLAPQTFHYLSNTSFRGPEHLLVEWDPALNPERRDPAVLGRSQPVRIGESSRAAVARTLRVEGVRTVAEDIVELRLAPADGRALPRWTPGAHIDLLCGGEGLSRQYSLCGDPADAGALQVAVLRDPASRGGSAWIHANARPGDLLTVRGPRNHFRFEEEGARRVILVAGGIGITPIAAMARRARELGMDYELHYSGRSRATMAYVQELAALHGDRLHLHVRDEGTRADYRALLAEPRPDTRVYACGPARLLDELAACCAAWPDDALRVEHFQAAPGKLDPSRELAFEVECKDSGLVVSVPADRTLLEALRAANIDVPSDCGEGLCGSCEVHVLSGEVDHRDVVLTRAERQAGDKMMACCSRACAGGRLVLEI